ncbi:WD40 repeat domain-containing protein [Nocardia carnea]|uniref:WD40 repeat domain-containing protein n=1 Tax=Nocardia carnea TaxID=37328 RepID=UPI002454F51B|nr:WD40 repeat domain-containing protein [Nocardia carnea]
MSATGGGAEGSISARERFITELAALRRSSGATAGDVATWIQHRHGVKVAESTVGEWLKSEPRIPRDNKKFLLVVECLYAGAGRPWNRAAVVYWTRLHAGASAENKAAGAKPDSETDSGEDAHSPAIDPPAGSSPSAAEGHVADDRSAPPAPSPPAFVPPPALQRVDYGEPERPRGRGVGRRQFLLAAAITVPATALAVAAGREIHSRSQPEVTGTPSPSPSAESPAPYVPRVEIDSHTVLATLDESPYVMAFSPEGDLFAVGGFKGGVVLCNTMTQQQVATLAGHRDTIDEIMFSPDGAVLATMSGAEVRFWNTTTHQQIGDPLYPHPADIEGSYLSISAVAFSPDGLVFATACAYDASIRLWDRRTMNLVSVLADGGRSLLAMTFLLDSHIVSVGRTIRTWNRFTRRTIDDVPAQEGGRLVHRYGG